MAKKKGKDFDFAQEAETDSRTAPDVKDADLKVITSLAIDFLEQRENIATIELHLKNAKEAMRKVSEDLLPSAMQEIGIMEFRMESGSLIRIKEDVSASITKANEPAAFNWLDENGFGDVIKTDVKLVFGRGDQKDLEKMTGLLAKAGFGNYSQKSAVHSGTLKALVKEQMEKGIVFPDNIFSIYPYFKTEVK